MTSKQLPLLRAAIVGASTLKGREVKSVLADRKFPVKKLVLLDSDEDLGRLTEFDGEPVLSMAIDESSFDLLDVVFFAGSAESTRAFAHLAKRKNFLLVDLTHAFTPEQGVPLFLESGRGRRETLVPCEGLITSPHPAAITVASILRRLAERYDIRKCVVSIFEPASEWGNSGVEELKQQTIDLFSFQKGSQAVFARQLAFNLLSRFGSEAKEDLLGAEKVVAAHLKWLLSPRYPLPSITLIQAPVFHSHAFSLFIEVDVSISVADFEAALQSDFITVFEATDEPPSPVQAAGTDLIQIGGVKRDLLNSNGIWFWAVSDNLRLAALNAVAAAEAILLE